LSELDGNKVTLLAKFEWNPSSGPNSTEIDLAVADANKEAQPLVDNNGKTLADRWAPLLRKLEQFVPLVDKIAEVCSNYLDKIFCETEIGGSSLCWSSVEGPIRRL
jgi:hypothetical protein